MNAIVIQSNSKINLKLLSDIAKKMGDQVVALSDEQVEDLALGHIMDKVKTGKNVSRKMIMEKLMR